MRFAALSLALAFAALGGPLLRNAWAQDEAPPAAAPSQTAPPRTTHDNLAHVTLRSDEPGTFYLVRNGFERLCTAPCEADLPVGMQRLAVSEGKEKFVAGPAIEIRDGASVHASRETHGLLRGFGVALLVAGPVASLAMFIGYVASVKQEYVCSETCSLVTQSDPGLLVAGALLLPATITPGVLMVVFGRDRTRFELEGGTSLAPWPRDVALLRAVKEGPSSAPGLAATLRF